MNQIPGQLLNSSNIPLMGTMDQNINLINQVPMPPLIQNQPKIQQVPKIPKKSSIQGGPKPPINPLNPQDTSK